VAQNTAGLLAGPLGIFVAVAVAAIVLGVMSGVFNQVVVEMKDTNGTSLIPQQFQDIVNQAFGNYASLALTIMLFVGVIAIVMWLARVAGG